MFCTPADLLQAERLRHLHQVRGWRFHLKRTAEPPHHVDELVYSHHHGRWLDVLRVRSAADARAARLDYESVVRQRPLAAWSTEGTLRDVLDELASFTDWASG